MHRRQFLKQSAIAGAGIALSAPRPAFAASEPTFRLNYAPHFGMFAHSAGKDPIDQLKFAADQGFRAWEDNGMKSRPVDEQERIAEAMQRLDIEMGVISATRGASDKPTFTSEDASVRGAIIKQMHEIVPVAQRVRARWLTVVPGDVNPKLPEEYQTTLAVDLLKRCCDVVEPHGLVLVIEPLNRYVNHPGKFLWKCSQGFTICQAVTRPSCKLLFDVYHEQISEGHLTANIERAWDEIGYFQLGDTPGRNEPGTGEINYGYVLKHIYERGYRGIVGMEHGNAQDGAAGEQAVIAAYRKVDPK